MFSIRSKSGIIFTDVGMGSNKEITHESREMAMKSLVQYEKSLPFEEFYIHEIIQGRPPIGETKKISLTLDNKMWNWFDDMAEGNRSAFLRELVHDKYWSSEEWSNNACFGYVIKSAIELGYTDKQISELIGEMHYSMDMKTVDEAKDIYNNSSF